jgi:hypothetical protein
MLLAPTLCYGQLQVRDERIPLYFPGGMATGIVDWMNPDIQWDGSFANDRIKAAGTPRSAAVAKGHFTGGNIAFGTLLPLSNRDESNPEAFYKGGIGIEAGFVFATGYVDDQNPDGAPARSVDQGIGAEGPNNGLPFSGGNQGEVSEDLSLPSDDDAAAEFQRFGLELPPGSGDANVLEFDVIMHKPGFLRILFVYATDEFDAWPRQTFNDTPMVFIGGKNVITFKETIAGSTTEKLLTLADLEECDFLLPNDVAPAPDSLDGSDHHNDSLTFYDHEYGGFTVLFTKEAQILNKGTHRVKIVIQDVTDPIVDSALFIPDRGLKFLSIAIGDFDLDGDVDTGDYTIWRKHTGVVTSGATVRQGDADADGDVDDNDYAVWRSQLGATGNRDWKADFDRNGTVNRDDYYIWKRGRGPRCKDRFQGDADGDGDVDGDDLDIWGNEYALANPKSTSSTASVTTAESSELDTADMPTEAELEEMGITQQMLDKAARAMEQVDTTLKDIFLPPTADADGDGDVADEDDLKILDNLLKQ